MQSATMDLPGVPLRPHGKPMKQDESQPKPTPVFPANDPISPEVRAKIDEFNRQIGKALTGNLNRNALASQPKKD